MTRIAPHWDENYCMACFGPNLMHWHAPHPLWNAVMRVEPDGSDTFGIICPSCFAALAEECGITGRHWHVEAHDVLVDLPTVSPGGRLWDAATCRWVEPPDPAA